MRETDTGKETNGVLRSLFFEILEFSLKAIPPGQLT